MKSKNIPADIKIKTIKEAQNEIKEIMTGLETEETRLESSIEEYNRMMLLNYHIQEEFKKKALNLSTYMKKKLLEIKEKHEDKIYEVKGTGILNGIVFKSFLNEIANIIEKFPLKFISNKSFFLKKLTATVISCELYEKHNILAAVSDSSNSNHLFVSPSLIINNDEIDIFFEKLDNVLIKGASLKSLELIFNFLKSKIK